MTPDGNLKEEFGKDKNFSGKFNYDKKGFEVINNQGGIAASFDIIKPNTIKIQGFFPYKEANRILLLRDTGFTTASFWDKRNRRNGF